VTGVGARVHDRIVVGGGIAGLAAAWWAAHAGEDVLLLEESDRLGGVIATQRHAGYRVERAASTVPSTARNLLRLLATLPEVPALIPAGPAARAQLLLTRHGLEPVPRSPRALLRTRLLGIGDRLRALAEVVRAPRRARDAETLDAFVRRRFGSAVAERFLAPFTNGVYGAHPRRLGAADAFPSLVALEARRGSILRGLAAEGGPGRRHVLVPPDGMESLPRALGAALGPRAVTRAAVRTIVPRGEVVEVRTADGVAYVAREVVLSVPPPRQAALLEPFAPHVGEILDAVAATPIAVIALGLPAGHAPLPEAFGFLRGRGARTRVLGATFASRIAPTAAPEGHGLALVYLGGSEDPEALALDDARLADLAVEGLGGALGTRLTPDLVHVIRHPQAIPLFAPGHRSRMARAQSLLARWRIRLAGAHVSGVGLDACCREAAPLVPDPA
jgi:protoporphyrinogen/coproporphyrinogen III oxidase